MFYGNDELEFTEWEAARIRDAERVAHRESLPPFRNQRRVAADTYGDASTVVRNVCRDIALFIIITAAACIALAGLPHERTVEDQPLTAAPQAQNERTQKLSRPGSHVSPAALAGPARVNSTPATGTNTTSTERFSAVIPLQQPATGQNALPPGWAVVRVSNKTELRAYPQCDDQIVERFPAGAKYLFRRVRGEGPCWYVLVHVNGEGYGYECLELTPPRNRAEPALPEGWTRAVARGGTPLALYGPGLQEVTGYIPSDTEFVMHPAATPGWSLIISADGSTWGFGQLVLSDRNTPP
jgi:hypothetical protein